MKQENQKTYAEPKMTSQNKYAQKDNYMKS